MNFYIQRRPFQQYTTGASLKILSLFNTGDCFNNAIFPRAATFQNLAKLPQLESENQSFGIKGWGTSHSSQSDSFLNICQVSPSSRGLELLFMKGLIIMPRIWRGKGEEGLGNLPIGGQKLEKLGVYSNWNKEGKKEREIFFLGGIKRYQFCI